MSHLRRVPKLLLMAMLSSSCFPVSPVSEGGTLTLRSTGVSGGLDPLGGFTAHDTILAGTLLCPDVACRGDCPAPVAEDGGEDAEVVSDCFNTTVSGAALLEGRCIRLAGDGVLDWGFTPTPCAANERAYAPLPDHFIFTSIDPGRVRARVVSALEILAQREIDAVDGLVRLDAPDTLPADWSARGPLQVFADRPITLPLGLIDESDNEVMFRPDDAALELLGDDGIGVWSASAVAPLVTIAAGSSATLALTVNGARFPMPPVTGVGVGALTDLSVVRFRAPPSDARSAQTFVMRGIVRTSDGAMVIGAPIQWRVREGRIALDPSVAIYDGRTFLTDASDKPPDVEWAAAVDCQAPPGPEAAAEERSAIVEARIDGLSTTFSLQWTVAAAPSAAARDAFRPSSLCPRPEGCSCRTQTTPPALLGALVLFGVARRRRGKGRASCGLGFVSVQCTDTQE